MTKETITQSIYLSRDRTPARPRLLRLSTSRDEPYRGRGKCHCRKARPIRPTSSPAAAHKLLPQRPTRPNEKVSLQRRSKIMDAIPFTPRQSFVKVCIVWVLGLAIVVGSSSVGLAKEKKPCNNVTKDAAGCTQCDLQSLGAGSCLNMNFNDLQKYPGQSHVVKCGRAGKQCCIVNDNTGQEISCRPISNVKPPIIGPGLVTPPVLPGRLDPGPHTTLPEFGGSPQPRPSGTTTTPPKPGTIFPRGVEPEPATTKEAAK